jgi:hypothetical protein
LSIAYCGFLRAPAAPRTALIAARARSCQERERQHATVVHREDADAISHLGTDLQAGDPSVAQPEPVNQIHGAAMYSEMIFRQRVRHHSSIMHR